MVPFTNLLTGRSPAEGAKCDGARILNSRAERNREHLAFHADRQDFVGGGDGERSRGDAAGSTSVDWGASGLELDGDVIAGDGRDLQSTGSVEWWESWPVTALGDAKPRLMDILRRSDSSLAARWSANSLSNGRLRPTTALRKDNEWIYNLWTTFNITHMRKHAHLWRPTLCGRMCTCSGLDQPRSEFTDQWWCCGGMNLCCWIMGLSSSRKKLPSHPDFQNVIHNVLYLGIYYSM